VRPLLHFTAKTGWLNDPHAITYRDGMYHAFYQSVPDSLVWAPHCHWGHAVGPDLFHLTHLPVALAPGEGDDGIWTGTLVTDATGTSRIFYTSVVHPDIGIGQIRMALPEDNAWINWKKGPVVAKAPTGLDLVAFRDPFIFRDGEMWRMLIGAGLRDGMASVLSYVSQDLQSWVYQGIAVQRSTHETSPVWMGALWECPQLFEMDGRHVLVSSVWENDVPYYAGYGIGTWTDGQFTAETWGQLTFGPSYYAPSFFRDADGRPCLTFWMRGIQDTQAGWSGTHSVPYVLSLNDDHLVATPHPDLSRYQSQVREDRQVEIGSAFDAIWTPQGEAASIEVLSGSGCVLHVQTRADELIARTRDETWKMPYSGSKVHMILDGPVVELSTSDGLLGFAIASSGESLTINAEVPSLSIRPLSRSC
jgi:beta-fructofuranosidase